jgi:response regulator RpfG family c-di-GMP phosphodiesterase
MVYYLGKVIYWFHKASREADTYHTKYQMVLLKYGCLVGTLYPFSIIPQSEIIEPRPNLIIALLVGILFYLGYAMPKWLEQTLIRFELNPRLLRQNLWLVGFISEYYNKIAPVSPTRFEYILRRFCKFLSLSKRQIDLIVKASYLRNVGELYFQEDDQLLLKISDKKVRIDWQMSRNVELSAHIAKEILQFSQISEILWHIRERWDGLGYPDELKGKEIPTESRILALVDCFTRVQNEDDDDDALRMLAKEAGKKFDPNLVEQFHEFWKKRGQIKLRKERPCIKA